MKVAASLLLASSLITLAQAPAKRPMTFTDLMAMKRVSDPQISPSGKWVLFSVTDVSLEKNTKTNHLWIVPLDGSAKERQLTTASGESNGRFSPDGKWVMFSHEDQIWIAPFDEANGTLGDDHVVTALETGADGAIWAPDSQHILFTSSVYPECESKLPWRSTAMNGSATANPSAATRQSVATQPSVVTDAGSVKGTASAVPSQYEKSGALAPEGSLSQRNDEEANCNALKDAVASKNPVQAQIFDHLLYRHWNAYVGPKHSHIFYADAMSGTHAAPTDLTPASVIGDHEAPTFSLGGPLGYAISPDGKEIAYVTNLDKVAAESTNNDIFTLQVGADPHTAKQVSTSPGSDDGPQYSPDGKYLAWRSQARNGYESDKFDLVQMDRNTQRAEKLTAHFPGWVDEFTVTDVGPVFTSAYEGEERLYGFSPMDPHNIEVLAKGAEYGSIQSLNHRDFAPAQLVLTKMKASAPAEIVSLRTSDSSSSITKSKGDRTLVADDYGLTVTNDASEQYLTHVFDPITAAFSLQSLESFWFTGANGTKVQGFLIRPPNFDPTKKYPVKFLIHGGPQGAWGDAWSYRWNPELFAANGYVVVMVNPRGSTGYGQNFLEQVSGDWGGRSIDDLMRGLDYAEQHFPFIDKNRECALGASYGGFAANWLLTHTNRFKCIVTHDGMYNPQSAFGTTEELWFNEWEFRPLATTAKAKNPSSRPEAAGRSGETPVLSDAHPATDSVVEQTAPAHPWDFYDKPASQDPFRKWSPMLNIKNAHTPTLVVHGQRDYRLDVSEGFQLFTALQLLHIPSKMLYFPDEGHWVLKPKNSELWYETVNDWCDRWTGTNKYASVGPEKNPAAALAKPAALDKTDARKDPSQHPDK